MERRRRQLRQLKRIHVDGATTKTCWASAECPRAAPSALGPRKLQRPPVLKQPQPLPRTTIPIYTVRIVTPASVVSQHSLGTQTSHPLPAAAACEHGAAAPATPSDGGARTDSAAASRGAVARRLQPPQRLPTPHLQRRRPVGAPALAATATPDPVASAAPAPLAPASPTAAVSPAGRPSPPRDAQSGAGGRVGGSSAA